MPSNANPKGHQAFEHELSKLKCAYTEVKSKDPEITSSTSLKLSDFMNRPFAICCILMVAHEFNGVFTMMNYAKVIFEKSGSSLPSGTSTIIVGAIQVFGSYVSSLLIERLGRKVIISKSHFFRIINFKQMYQFYSIFIEISFCWQFHRLVRPFVISFWALICSWTHQPISM